MAVYLGNNLISYEGGNDGYGFNSHLLIKKTYSINLGQTNYASITPSTTNQTLTLPATTISTSGGTSVTCFRIGPAYDGTPIDFNNHDYVGFTECVIEYNYGTNNVSGTIHPIRYGSNRDYQEGRYYNSVDPSTGKLKTTSMSRSSSYIQKSDVILYQSASNTYNVVNTSQVGIHYGGTSSISWQTGSNYIDFLMQSVGVKVSASYAPEEALLAVNPANTIITMI